VAQALSLTTNTTQVSGFFFVFFFSRERAIASAGAQWYRSCGLTNVRAIFFVFIALKHQTPSFLSIDINSPFLRRFFRDDND
jgi:hypothetical protein